MARRNNVNAFSVGAEAVRVFGDVCELVGRIGDACETAGGEGGRGPYKLSDLLDAHRALMDGQPGAGALRAGEARILRGAQVAYVPPLALRLPLLMDDLMAWLAETDDHPVIASCVFHYQLLCVHPFDDGNGRLARLWQSRIIESWRPGVGALDLEPAVGARKDAYLEALAVSDRRKDAGPFVLFMLEILRGELESALQRRPRAPSRPDPAQGASLGANNPSESVERLLAAFGDKTLTGAALMKNLGMSHRGTFRKNYLDPALELGLVEMTQPDSPRSPTQRYRLTPAGRGALAGIKRD